MYTDAVQWAKIRKMVLVDSTPVRKISNITNISRKTIKKMSNHRIPPGYRRLKPIRNPKLGDHAEYIKRLMHQNKCLAPENRLTVKSIFEQTRDERGYEGGYSTVKEFISKNGPFSKKVNNPNSERSKKIFWGDTYDLITSLTRSDGVAFLQLLSGANQSVFSQKRVENFFQSHVEISKEEREAGKRTAKIQKAREWMHNVLQGNMPRGQIRRDVGEIEEFDKLLQQLYQNRLQMRNRALCVLADANGIAKTTIFSFLGINKVTGYKYLTDYKSGGCELLNHRKRSLPKKEDIEEIKNAVFSTLHEPPSLHGINRTTWTRDKLISVLEAKGIVVGKDVLRQITKNGGFKWRKARTVLTSKDPEYREKLNRVQDVLRNLSKDEAFFSIDEFGPLAVKKKGGRKLVDQNENYTVPQWQKSKGSLIMTAALELSSNQVTHFYSDKKNTAEMIKLMYLLIKEYKGYQKLWMSWDAASWHMSKKLFEEIDSANVMAKITGSPMIETAPLPAGAQFLNVIESVFSGLARGVIHNSDYQSVKDAKAAIDLYFEERNLHFQSNPKRAGKKIWGEERTPSTFHEANNCKDPNYM